MNSLVFGKRRCCVLLVLLAACFWVSNAFAHQSSVTYVELTDKQRAQGLWSFQLMLPLEQLDLKFDLDSDRDGLLSRQELDRQMPLIVDYATARASLSAGHGTRDTACERSFINHGVDRHLDSKDPAVFLTLRLQFKCAVNAARLTLDYTVFADFDAAHRALLSFGGTQQIVVPGALLELLPEHYDPATGKTQPDQSAWAAMPGYLQAGFHHILIGWDHLAFLLALVIPLITAPGGVKNRQLRLLLVTVTVFTLGHSISLAAATLGWLVLPPRIVELVIAASIVVAAGVCLLRRGFTLSPMFAGLFGLIHGFGFANVLEIGGSTASEKGIGLLGFNLGIEAGQLLFVGLILPLLWLVARSALSRSLVTKALPLALVVAGVGWFAERLTNSNFIPG